MLPRSIYDVLVRRVIKNEREENEMKMNLINRRSNQDEICKKVFWLFWHKGRKKKIFKEKKRERI